MEEKSLGSGRDDPRVQGSSSVRGADSPRAGGQRTTAEKGSCPNYPSEMESKKWHSEKKISSRDSAAAAPEGSGGCRG